MISNILVGTDPEVFLRDGITSRFIPSFKFFKGDKKDPEKLLRLGEGFALQCDNVMVEFNVPACKDPDLMQIYLQVVKAEIKNRLPKHINVSPDCSALFENEDLIDDRAKEFGCSPDFNAWTLNVNAVGMPDPNLRCAGGHIHIGYENPKDDISLELIKALDLYLGVPSILLDSDTRRRQMYGKAGAFRLTNYGVEYRVLSNFWIFLDDHIEWVFRSIQRAVKHINNRSYIKSSSDLGKMIVECINSQNKALAKSLYERHIVVDSVVEKATTLQEHL